MIVSIFQAVCSTLIQYSNEPEGSPTENKVKEQLTLILNKYCNDITWCMSSLSSVIFETSDCHEPLLCAIVDVAKRGKYNSKPFFENNSLVFFTS